MTKDKNIYWIGGSPCSGKSTIAELLVSEYGFNYYKRDDHLDEYMRKGTAKNIDIMNKYALINLDQNWLRNV